MLTRLRAAAQALRGRRPPPNAYLGDHTALTELEGMMIYVDTRSTDVAPHLLLRGMWEPEATGLFQRLIRPGDTVLDLGANLGVYTLLAARAVGPTGRVHGFEPNRRYAGLIARSLSVNGYAGHAQVHPVAVGETAGMAALRFFWDWGGGGHLALGAEGPAEGQESQPCPVVALDEMFDDPDFRVQLLKIDIEGAEARALRGMWRLLERSPEARLMFEFAPGLIAGHGVAPGEMIHLLRELGFRFWEIGEASRLREVSADSLAMAEDGLRNILAARGAPVPG
jgi:FkbM family methyltransferase